MMLEWRYIKIKYYYYYWIRVAKHLQGPMIHSLLLIFDGIILTASILSVDRSP